jgi:hypothetical protein
MRIPTTPFSHRRLPQWCFWPYLVRTSPVDRLAFYFPVIALFPIVFCLFSLFFGFGFPCIVLSLFVLCVFYFCSSSDLLRVSLAALHLLPGFIQHSPATNFKRTCQW